MKLNPGVLFYMVLALGGFPAGEAAAQNVFSNAFNPSSLIGTWRPYGANVASPTANDVECPKAMGGMECAKLQGSFPAGVYLRIGKSADGSLRLISDGTADARITPAKATPGQPLTRAQARTVDLVLTDGTSGHLIFGGRSGHCDAAALQDPPNACFDLYGFPAHSALANGTYELAAFRPTEARAQTLGDNFATPPDNFQNMLGCVDMTRIDPRNLATLGCDAATPGASLSFLPLFVGPNEAPLAGSKRYDPFTYAGHSMAIPFGWHYVALSRQFGQSSTSIIETGQELMDSTSSSLGVNASVNILFFNASMKYNQKTQEMVDRMYQNKETYSHYGYFSSSYALILDKQNVILSPGFYAAANALVRSPRPDYDAFLKLWGTHYVHAATFGETGQLLTSMTSKEVSEIHENSVDVSVSASAGVSIDGIGGSVGVDSDSAKAQKAKLDSILGQDSESWTCTGGATCDGKSSSSGNAPPVLLDLRPISELFAPPFLQTVSIDRLAATRAALTQHIASYAFRPADARNAQAAAQFMQIKDMTIKPSLKGTSLPASVTLTIGDMNKTFEIAGGTQDGQSAVAVQAPGETWAMAWMPGATVSATGAAPSGSCGDATGPNAPVATPGTAVFPTDQTSGSVTVSMSVPCGQPVGPTPAYADYGMDIAGYCTSIGYQGADNQSGDAYGWRCQPGGVGLDLFALCAAQVGQGFTPIVVDPVTGRWVCRAPSTLTGDISFSFAQVPAAALLLNETVTQTQ